MGERQPGKAHARRTPARRTPARRPHAGRGPLLRRPVGRQLGPRLSGRTRVRRTGAAAVDRGLRPGRVARAHRSTCAISATATPSSRPPGWPGGRGGARWSTSSGTGPCSGSAGRTGRWPVSPDAPARAATRPGPVYLNSRTTGLYHKGSLLFGLYEGRRALAAGARPVLVEGPLDAIAVSAAGPVRGRLALRHRADPRPGRPARPDLRPAPGRRGRGLRRGPGGPTGRGAGL